MAATRAGVARINALALEALHPRAEPLARLEGTWEDNPDNYEPGGQERTDRPIRTTTVPIYKGLHLYLTRNVRKQDDYVNGMRVKVLRWQAETKVLWVRTETGKVLPITPWHDAERGNIKYYPIRLGYCSAMHKVQGDEFQFIVIYQDCGNMPAVAYTALSRVPDSGSYLIGGDGKLTRKHFVPVTLRRLRWQGQGAEEQASSAFV